MTGKLTRRATPRSHLEAINAPTLHVVVDCNDRSWPRLVVAGVCVCVHVVRNDLDVDVGARSTSCMRTIAEAGCSNDRTRLRRFAYNTAIIAATCKRPRIVGQAND